MKPVDLLGSEKVRRELKFLMPAFQQLDDRNRQKAYIAAAWQFVRAGDVEEALKLVDLLSEEYVRDVMPEQMDADPAFSKMCEVVTSALIESAVHVPSYTPPSGLWVQKAGAA